MDAHYTPQTIASELVATADDLRPTVIADLCAGRGDLLLQAERVWPQATFAAVDIEPSVVRHLKRLRPYWRVGRCDLLRTQSRNRSPILKSIRRRVSLLLLNPPFSCRGNTRFCVAVDDGRIHARSAMSFLLTSLGYLHETGTAIAILPYGVVHNQKDRDAWSYVTKRYTVTLLPNSTRQSFPRTSVRVALVRLTPSHIPTSFQQPSIPVVAPPRGWLRATMIRGCQPIHLLGPDSSGPTLVHSTDIRGAEVHLNGRRGNGRTRSIGSPAVLLPRVGRLTTSKIAIIHPRAPIVLSDCVIALATQSIQDAKAIRKRLFDQFPFLLSQYVGTGAPFITIERLNHALTKIGVLTDAH